jgi:hypothetical protein
MSSKRGPPAAVNCARSSGSRARPAAGSCAAIFAGLRAGRLAQNYGAPSLDDVDTVTRLLPQLATATASVVFDHNLGGGANQYRRQLIGDRLAAGSIVLLCTYNLPTLDYRLQVFRPGGSEDIYRMSSFVGLDTDSREGEGDGDFRQQSRLLRRAPGFRRLDCVDAREPARDSP